MTKTLKFYGYPTVNFTTLALLIKYKILSTFPTVYKTLSFSPFFFSLFENYLCARALRISVKIRLRLCFCWLKTLTWPLLNSWGFISSPFGEFLETSFILVYTFLIFTRYGSRYILQMREKKWEVDMKGYRTCLRWQG